jgi:hypothetical protein
MCHHQGVFVVVIIALSMVIVCKCIYCEYSQLSHFGPCDSFMVTTTKTPLCWHMRCAETRLRTGNVRIIHFVHVKLILQTNSSSDARYVQMNALPCLNPEYQKMIKKAHQCILYDVSRIQLTFSRIIYLRLILTLFSHLCQDAMPIVILFFKLSD